MICRRRLRRLKAIIQKHRYGLLVFLFTFSLVVAYYDEITYNIHIRTVDVKPYEQAITLWSTDYHIR